MYILIKYVPLYNEYVHTYQIWLVCINLQWICTYLPNMVSMYQFAMNMYILTKYGKYVLICDEYVHTYKICTNMWWTTNTYVFVICTHLLNTCWFATNRYQFETNMYIFTNTYVLVKYIPIYGNTYNFCQKYVRIYC